MTDDRPPPPRTRPTGEREPYRPPSERSDTVRVSSIELADMMEAAFTRAGRELLAAEAAARAASNQTVREQAERVEASLDASAVSAALTASELQCKSLQKERRRMIYTIVAAIAGVIGILGERLLAKGPKEVARETAVEVVDEHELERLERIDAMIRALEAERDTTVPD